jgi:hypothetical protein
MDSNKSAMKKFSEEVRDCKRVRWEKPSLRSILKNEDTNGKTWAAVESPGGNSHLGPS